MNTPNPGETWERKRDKVRVIVDCLTFYRTGTEVSFTEQPMLIQYDRGLEMFLRNYRKVV